MTRKSDLALLVRMPEELKDAIAAEAVADDRTQAQVVRRALRMYLATPETERRRWRER